MSYFYIGQYKITQDGNSFLISNNYNTIATINADKIKNFIENHAIITKDPIDVIRYKVVCREHNDWGIPADGVAVYKLYGKVYDRKEVIKFISKLSLLKIYEIGEKYFKNSVNTIEHIINTEKFKYKEAQMIAEYCAWEYGHSKEFGNGD